MISEGKKLTDPQKLPEHVAIIMDGNGRWARRRGMDRVRGHRVGAESVREVVRASRELGIHWLTLYAFSEENWKRSKFEIRALMKLLRQFLKSELEEMLQNGIRLQAIGRITKLDAKTREILADTIEKTAKNREMVLTLALSYGGRQEILDAFRSLASQIQEQTLAPEEITEEAISRSLYTSSMPDPDLLIRTSGEYRVSNFLLWQIAYAEMYVTPTLWPDFRKEEFLCAIEDYRKRERRFGATSEQVASKA
ncbi:MAG: isoprenyl transferase [Deltaproteobacteria bacterium]|nr:MAG: isoprenyl transferase [Deltaproteobacteria bacterium]